jgi:hypothetical protein
MMMMIATAATVVLIMEMSIQAREQMRTVFHTREPPELLAKPKGLESKLPSGGEDESTSACAVGRVSLQALEHGDQKGRSLPGSCARHGDHIMAFQHKGQGLPLYGRRNLVPFLLDRSEHLRA